LLVFGVLAQSVGTLMRSYSSLFSFGDKLMALGVAAVLVQVALSVREKKYLSLIQSSVVFGVTVASQALSGWKGSVLWTAIALGAWLFPLYPKVTASVGVVFVAFWGLWFYPFATSLRRPLWYEGVTQERAVEIALDQTRDLTLRERAETLWELLSVRGSDLKHFAKYVAFVPETRSFYGWELVGNSITALTPRLLWPDKPDIERLSMERVYEAGITAEEVIVSAKTNLYQDGYLSGGYTGVFLFCLSFGILAMWISQTCERFFGGYEYGTGLMYFGLFATPINLALNVEFMISGLAGSALVALLMFAVARSAGWLVKDTASALDARH
jgi:hypothetical protein